MEWEYDAYFTQFYASMLFIFAVFSLLMGAMQVVLAVRTVLEPDDAWHVFARAARGFALFVIFFVAYSIAGLLMVLVGSLLGESIYVLKDLANLSREKS